VTSSPNERRSVSEIVVAVAVVIAALLPVPLLAALLGNMLASDSPVYLWVVVVGLTLVITIAGSVLLGLALWNPRKARPRMQRMGLVALVISYGVAAASLVLSVVP
jgi:hypothetical protein